MINIAILDDEPANVARLRELVAELMPRDVAYALHEASAQSELADLMSAGTQVDILIADVVMPEGQPSGIEVVRQLFPPECGTQVIYVSGYLSQALEVYATNHVYFLLKPIDPDKLADALKKALSALGASTTPMLQIKAGHRQQLVNPATVTYLESSLHKVTVHCRDAVVETYARLDDLEQQLPASFSRCHRSYLVNLAAISALDDGGLLLHDGTRIPVSRRRARQVQHDLLAFVSGRT